MNKQLHSWTVPHEKVFLLKAETILLAVLVVLVFLFSFVIFDQRWWPTSLSTALFIFIFIIITHLTRKIYPVQETYHVTNTGIDIHSKSRKKISKTHVKFKDINNVRFDHLFQGGRLETKDKRYPLFFNTKEEILKLERILKKKIKQ